ncbi:choice-of-anchor I family protein [Larkinella ripae]
MKKPVLSVLHTSSSLILSSLLVVACSVQDHIRPGLTPENPASFKEISSTDLGGEAASEISAYDPACKRLFVVNNDQGVARVEVLDLSSYPAVTRLPVIDLSTLGGVANSVAVHDGKLAIALEALNKQEKGSVLVLNTCTLAQIKRVSVGALPDMVTFSPDGKYIVTADEGEPNDAYTVDPVGSVSIINVADTYSVKTLDFSPFESQQTTLMAGGFRIFGKNASFAQDIEPEYVAISADSKKAWVTLQENNGIAEVDLEAGAILQIKPLGTKDLSLAANAIDPTNTGNTISFGTWPVKSFYLPDAIAYFAVGGKGYLITANEGDTRAYTGFNEEVRVGALTLDPTVFPAAATLQMNANLGRLLVTSTAGDANKDGKYEALYAIGGRGFSILDAATQKLVYETGRSLEDEVVKAGLYDDGRSDDKGVEPEGVTTGILNGKTVAFIALERADAIAVYDVSNPAAPQFLQMIATGDAPEGVLFVPAANSPNGRSMLVVSSEGDGTVKIYQPN